MNDKLTSDTTIALMQAAQGQQVDVTKKAKQARNLEKIENAAQEFEAVFLNEMLKPMFEGISTEAPFGGGKGEEIFRGMLLQEYGKMLAQTGSVGISDSVKNELVKIQEAYNNGSSTSNK